MQIQMPRVHVPIIGESFKMAGWVLIVHGHCTCEAKTPLMFVGFGHVAQCPDCKRGHTLASITHNAQTGQGEIRFAQVLVPSLDQLGHGGQS